MNIPLQTWAVVPVKDIGLAKQRLSTIFDSSFRHALVLAMLEDTLRAVAGVTELQGIAVATADPDASEVARRFGAQVWHDAARDGLNEAINAAVRRLGAMQAAILVLPADVPLVKSENLEDILHVHAAATVPAFTIVPARDRLGSNAIVNSPAGSVAFNFGPASFHTHLMAARRAGIEPRVVEIPSIALDIDTPADVDAFLQSPGDTASGRLLNAAREHRIPQRSFS